MSGILGSWDLFGGIPQAVYVCDNTDSSVVNVNVCNRSNVTTSISMAISSSATSPANAEWIEFESQLIGKGSLERTGIVLNPGQYLIVKSSRSNVNVVAWGVTNGEPVVLPAITQNQGSAPSWITPTSTIETGSWGTILFEAEGASSYSLISGSLPTGALLEPDSGRMYRFTLPGSPTNTTFTLRATSPTGFTADRTFTVRINTSAAPAPEVSGGGGGGGGGAPVAPWTFANTVLGTFSYTGTVFSFAAPSGPILVDVYGAQGGTASNDQGPIFPGAAGGRIQAYFQVPAGTTIYGLVGQQGGTGNSRAGGGGGGFSALWTGDPDPGLGTWLIGAGGGGGAGATGDNGVSLGSAGVGGSSTATQPFARTGGAGGAGGNGGSQGSAGSASGGGSGGNAPGDNSGGGGGGGSGAARGSAATSQYSGGSGGFGGGGGGASGGSGGWPYRVTGGGGGGGGWNGGAGGLHGAYGGAGGSNYYFTQTLTGTGAPAQLVVTSSGVQSGNGSIVVRV